MHESNNLQNPTFIQIYFPFKLIWEHFSTEFENECTPRTAKNT